MKHESVLWSFPATGPMYFVFCRLYPFSHQTLCHVWVLPAVISLLLTNTISPVRACLIMWWEKFRGSQKEDDCGPLSIQSYLVSCHAAGYIFQDKGIKLRASATKWSAFYEDESLENGCPEDESLKDGCPEDEPLEDGCPEDESLQGVFHFHHQ